MPSTVKTITEPATLKMAKMAVASIIYSLSIKGGALTASEIYPSSVIKSSGNNCSGYFNKSDKYCALILKLYFGSTGCQYPVNTVAAINSLNNRRLGCNE